MGSFDKVVPISFDTSGGRVAGALSIRLDEADGSDQPRAKVIEATDLTFVDGEEVSETEIDESASIGADILSLPELPSGNPADGDVGLCIHKGKAYRHLVGKAPAIVKGGQSSVNVWDLGAREGRNNSNEFQVAVNALRDGGKLRIPCGHFPAFNVHVNAGKDIVIEGESELGSAIVSPPGRDVFVLDDRDVKRRPNSVQIFRNLMFYMVGDGKLGKFDRRPLVGTPLGAAAIAYIQAPDLDEKSRQMAWRTSSVVLENVKARSMKDAVGATLVWSERALHGIRVRNVVLGDHGTTVAGLDAAIAFGFQKEIVGECQLKELRVDGLTQHGGLASIQTCSAVNGAIVDHATYGCKHPLHISDFHDPGDERPKGDLELRELHYDLGEQVFDPLDPTMMMIDVDGLVFGTIRIKGGPAGGARPEIRLLGKNFEGARFRIDDTLERTAPRFHVEGTGHRYEIRADGLSADERKTLINGKPGLKGITVR